MKDTKFYYWQEVRIVSGFNRGTECRITDTRKYPFREREYQLQAYSNWFKESQLESIEKGKE